MSVIVDCVADDRAIDNAILSVFDDPRYPRLALENHPRYEQNVPFPHISIDNFLPVDVALAVAAQFPNPKSLNERWRFHDNKNVKRFFLDDSSSFDYRLKLFAAALTSRNFLLFLETLTGIEAVLPDPYFMGGGAMSTGTGGFLNIHVDYNFHHKLQAWRRMNALFYFTPDWDPQWGGALELWSIDGKTKVKSVTPAFNRVVIFTTTAESYHGQPERLQCPDDVYRHVFSAFYYSSKKGEKIDSEPHFTKYAIENSPYSQQIIENFKKRGA